MPVKVVVGNVYSKIVGLLPEEVQAHLDLALQYKVQNAKYMPSVKSGKWDGIVRLYNRYNGQSFYTGLLSLVRETLRSNKLEFEILDRRLRPEPNYPELKFTPPANYEERDYQQFTIDRSLKFTRGILSVCTGGGKTIIVTEAISRIKTYPFMFYVLTKDLMEQAHDVLSTYLKQPIGMIGDGKADIRKISVCTIQTAVMALNEENTKFKIDDYVFDDEDSWDEKGIENKDKADRIRKLIQTAQGVYFDEVHHAGCKTAKEVLEASINAYWRFGGSATPNRETGDDIMIQAMFGSKIVDISASYLIKKGVLVKPYIFFEPIKTNVNFHSYAKVYEHCVVKNNSFNDHVAAMARHLVERGQSVLILVKQIAHGKYLKDLIPNSEFLTGKTTSKSRTEYIEQLRQRGIMALIATSLADEGLDIPSLDAVLIPGGGKSSTRLFQRIGRTLRKSKSSKKDKSVVVIYDHDAKYLAAHTKRVRSLLKRETEFVIMNSKGENYICGEIDKILGVKNTQLNIFDAW
jgi:superfamily II DNA or RNA helicase